MGNSIENIMLVASILLILSVVFSKASDRLGLPVLLIFIFVGIMAGSEGPGGIYFDNITISKGLGVLALVMILFYGGMDTKWAAIKPVIKEGISLATLGVLITAVIMGYAAHILLNLSLMEGMLLGAIVSSTDAAAVFSILRSKGIHLKGNLKPLLELESGSNDPMAVFLTVGFIQVLTGGHGSGLSMIPTFFVEMAIGLGGGLLFGLGIVVLINNIKLQYEGLYPVITMALVMLTYALTAHIHGNGFLSVYIAGLVVGNKTFIHKKNLINFHEGIAWLMQITMFLALGLLVFPSKLVPVALDGVIISAVLIFVARPAAVFISLSFSKMTFKEKLLLSWVGLKGAVPVILAIFPLIAGVHNADVMFNIVFFIVLISALFQGSTISYVAKLLGLEDTSVSKRKIPIEIDSASGVNADLNEVMIPFGSVAVGKRLFEIGIPKGALVTLISREEQFIIPDGGTVLESGDVMLVMADKTALKTIERNVFVQRKIEPEKDKEGDKQ